MKKNITNIGVLITLMMGLGCDDEISVDLNDAPTLMVVDAWINDKAEPQVIRLSGSQPYFVNSQDNEITGAVVYLLDDENNRHNFLEQEDQTYVWIPSATDTLLGVGHIYTLRVEVGSNAYESITRMSRVPVIDSVTFRFEEGNAFIDDYFMGEFWSTDPVGPGDTYWIKAFKNGEFLGKSEEINIAYDASFSPGEQYDGFTFIPPIRDTVNPIDEDDDGAFLSPYSDGDSLYVEIHSISLQAYTFFNEVFTATDRPGGFAELFAEPLNNVNTNIVAVNSDEEVLGFFCMSAVASNGKTLRESDVPRE